MSTQQIIDGWDRGVEPYDTETLRREADIAEAQAWMRLYQEQIDRRPYDKPYPVKQFPTS